MFQVLCFDFNHITANDIIMAIKTIYVMYSIKYEWKQTNDPTYMCIHIELEATNIY